MGIRLVWGQKIASSNLATRTYEAFEMSYDPLDRKLLELESHLRDLTPEQRDKILDWIKTGKQRTAKINKSIKALQDSMDTLRVLIKYTVFDLEATRRENMELREQVAQLQRILEGHGYYTEGSIEIGRELPEGESGLIDLPEMGDFIHNAECDHPYDCYCECLHCQAFRERMSLGDGAD